MTHIAASAQSNRFGCEALACAPVVSGSAAAMEAANKILGELANEFGLGPKRAAALAADSAKGAAAQLVASLGSVGLSFASADNSHKAPTSGPTVGGTSNEIVR